MVNTEVNGATGLSSKPKNAVARKLKNKTYGQKGRKGRGIKKRKT